MSLPTVAVWRPLGSQWAKVGDVATYSELRFAPTHLDIGSWSMTLPYDDAALAIVKGRLLTFDWRGKRPLTGEILVRSEATDPETGQLLLNVSGVGAASRLGWGQAWPDPTKGLNDPAQPVSGLYSGPAETVVLDIIRQNLRDRDGMAITVPASAGRGGDVKARTRYDNLLELVTKKARRGGIGIRVGLVDTSGTRAQLKVSVYVPVDRSRRVELSQKIGTVREWNHTETAPTATRALVGGAGTGTTRVWRQVTTDASNADAAAWGGHRTVFVDYPDSFDNTELDQAGEEALDAGASTTSLALTATEAEGLLAFQDYDVGDKATGELVTGVSVVDVITSIEVAVTATGVDVTPMFGDPDAHQPELAQAQLIRGLRREVKQLQTRR